jgi:fucose permease
MGLINFFGKIAIGVAVLIIIIALVLGALFVACFCLGAYESATNPHISLDTQQEYTQLSQNVSQAQAAISRAVGNVTGG